MIVYIIIAWVVLAFIAGVIASSIGRNFFGYFFLSLITSPVLALIILSIFGRSEKEQALRELRITAEIEEIKKQREKVAQEEAEDEASQAQTTTATSSKTSEDDDDWATSLGVVGVILVMFIIVVVICKVAF